MSIDKVVENAFAPVKTEGYQVDCVCLQWVKKLLKKEFIIE